MLEQALLEPSRPVPQSGEVTYAHKLTTDDRALDWRRPARELDRVVRALSPHIGARTALDGRPVTVWRARPLEDGPAPGQVADPLVVGTAEGGRGCSRSSRPGSGGWRPANTCAGCASRPGRHDDRCAHPHRQR